MAYNKDMHEKVDLDCIDDLLQKDYCIIDILPEQVPAASAGRYFAIEQHYLKPDRRKMLAESYGDLLLKLNCYFQMVLLANGKAIADPEPETVEQAVCDQFCQPAGLPLYLVLVNEDMLIQIDGDVTYATVYGSDSDVDRILTKLAAAQGLHIFRPTQGETNDRQDKNDQN